MGMLRFTKKDKSSYHLENIPEAQQKAGARKFTRPTPGEISTLKVGDMVRLFFVLDFSTEDGCRAERMWVKISEINHHHFKGHLTNQPIYIKDISAGDIVCFASENIAAVLVPSGFDERKKALLSKRALEKQEINWAFKGEPNNETDSGWQLFYGDEDDEYNSIPSNIAIIALEDVLYFEPRLAEAFASAHHAFQWNEHDMRFMEVTK